MQKNGVHRVPDDRIGQWYVLWPASNPRMASIPAPGRFKMGIKGVPVKGYHVKRGMDVDFREASILIDCSRVTDDFNRGGCDQALLDHDVKIRDQFADLIFGVDDAQLNGRVLGERPIA